MNKYYSHIVKIGIIWGIATLSSLCLYKMNVRIENILLIYVVGVMISITETSNLIWGIGLAVIFVMTFNFLFTEPRYTFMIYDPNYFISLFVFVIVAIIISTLTNRLQKQKQIALYQQDITAKINDISNGFLNRTGYAAIKEYCQESLKKVTGHNNQVYIYEGKKFENPIVWWCYHHGKMCGKGQTNFDRDSIVCIPIKKNQLVYGVLVFDCKDNTLNTKDRIYIDTIISALILVLQREELAKEKEENQIHIEREKLKSTLLRSISHDLRTPLTSIAGGANFLYNNMNNIDQKTTINILKDIGEDAYRLNDMVENILNMTRIQEDNFCITKKMELVDDIIASALSAISTRKDKHYLEVDKPKDIILFPCDGHLLVQVLVNILDNACKHTCKTSKILLKAYIQRKSIVFQISDNGGGMDDDKIKYIFDDFFTTSMDKGDKQRGMGLGLAICKAIVEAHEGHITAYNNDEGGATFEITLPLKETIYE